MARTFSKVSRKTGTTISTGTTPKSLFSITAPANQKLVIQSLMVAFKGASPTGTPIELLGRVGVKSGGGASTTVTPAKLKPSDSTAIRATCEQDYASVVTWTGTPDIVLQSACHPQQGFLWREEIEIPAGSTFALESTSAAATDLIFEARIEE